MLLTLKQMNDQELSTGRYRRQERQVIKLEQGPLVVVFIPLAYLSRV